MNPPANWYPDPTGRHGQRYWDGEQWTEHVFTEGVQGVDPLDATGAGDDEAEPTSADEDGVADGEAAATSGPGNGAAAETSNLFGDAADAAVDDAAGEDAGAAGGTWEPRDEAPATDRDDAVAPEVEPEDVVGTLDEVNEVDDASAATAAVATEAQDGAGDDSDGEDSEDGEEEDPAAGEAPPQGDFSDAFMVTPETVSRLVSRQASTAPQPAEEAREEEPHEEAASSQEEDPAAAASSTEQASAPESDDAVAATAAPAGAIDAPPPSMPEDHTGSSPAPAAGGLGITGDLVGGAFAERSEAGPVALQNSRLLRCSLDGGSGVIARQGTMVAYQGDVGFERQGAGGVTRALKRAATGEGLAMMRAEGTGDVFFADGAQHVFLLHLEGGPGLSVNGRNVLAFSADLQWDIERVKGATLLAGGLFNTSLTGTGWVALVSDGEPVVLRTDEAPTHVDVNALVAWSGGLSTRITNTVSAKSLVGLGSGEAFQMAFDGSGIVVVQPSEGATGAAATN